MAPGHHSKARVAVEPADPFCWWRVLPKKCNSREARAAVAQAALRLGKGSMSGACNVPFTTCNADG